MIIDIPARSPTRWSVPPVVRLILTYIGITNYYIDIIIAKPSLNKLIDLLHPVFGPATGGAFCGPASVRHRIVDSTQTSSRRTRDMNMIVEDVSRLELDLVGNVEDVSKLRETFNSLKDT